MLSRKTNATTSHIQNTLLSGVWHPQPSAQLYQDSSTKNTTRKVIGQEPPNPPNLAPNDAHIGVWCPTTNNPCPTIL